MRVLSRVKVLCSDPANFPLLSHVLSALGQVVCSSRLRGAIGYVDTLIHKVISASVHSLGLRHGRDRSLALLEATGAR